MPIDSKSFEAFGVSGHTKKPLLGYLNILKIFGSTAQFKVRRSSDFKDNLALKNIRLPCPIKAKKICTENFGIVTIV